MLNQKQKKALEIMKSGNNVFLTGGAGTGKSYLINTFLNQLPDNKKKKILLCAPTGVAAINIGGATLHSTFRIPLAPCPLEMDEVLKIPKALKTSDIIIMDEISMCRIDTFDYISAILKKSKKNIQFICVGDFYQLPPVVTKPDYKIMQVYYGDKKWAFESNYWNEYNFKTFYLDVNMRQNNMRYNNLLNSLATGGNEDTIKELNRLLITDSIPNAINISPFNRDVDIINNNNLSNLLGEEKTYYGSISGHINLKEFQAPQQLVLKCGCRVMSLVNHLGDGICNGSLGTVIKMEENSVTVQFDCGVTREIEKYTWEKNKYMSINNEVVATPVGKYTQIPLKLAYAVTIHKSQGQTYDAININPNVFDAGMLYVALSRCRNINQVHISRPLSLSDVIVSPKVQQFYATIRDSL